MSKKLLIIALIATLALANDYDLLLSQEQGPHVPLFHEFAQKHQKLYTGPKHVYESLKQFKDNLYLTRN